MSGVQGSHRSATCLSSSRPGSSLLPPDAFPSMPDTGEIRRNGETGKAGASAEVRRGSGGHRPCPARRRPARHPRPSGLESIVMKAAGKKPTVYLDTTIVSSYWYEGTDVLALGRRVSTREWWDSERQHFTLWVSSVTQDELQAGHFPRQVEAVAMAHRLRFLPLLAAAREFAERLLDRHVVPDTKPGDALQMAIAVVHRIDYLLTWNYAHLANPMAQGTVGGLLRKRGLASTVFGVARNDSQSCFGPND